MVGLASLERKGVEASQELSKGLEEVDQGRAVALVLVLSKEDEL